jgi:hypothetical protein
VLAPGVMNLRLLDLLRGLVDILWRGLRERDARRHGEQEGSKGRGQFHRVFPLVKLM